MIQRISIHSFLPHLWSWTAYLQILSCATLNEIVRDTVINPPPVPLQPWHMALYKSVYYYYYHYHYYLNIKHAYVAVRCPYIICYWNAVVCLLQLSDSSVHGGVWCCKCKTSCHSPLQAGTVSGGIWGSEDRSRRSHQGHDCMQQGIEGGRAVYRCKRQIL